MKFMRYIVVLSLICALVLGCNSRPAIVDNTQLVIQPGRGITNLCEIGMTLDQVRRVTQDVKIHGINDRDVLWKRWMGTKYALVQTLGAILPIEENGKFETMGFYVSPYDSNATVPGLIVANPFRGTVADKLSFKDGPIDRSAVESHFGEAYQTVTNLSDAVSMAKIGKPFLHRTSGGYECLYYRHKGINFEFKSNVVRCVWIYRAVEPKFEAQR